MVKISTPTKPGPTTSEFKSKYLVQGIIAVVGFLVAIEVIPSDLAEQLTPFILGLVGAEGTYAISRGLAKSKR